MVRKQTSCGLVSSSLALAVAVALATAHSTHSTHVAAALAVVAAFAALSALATVRTALATVRATLATVGAALAAVAVRTALATVRATLATVGAALAAVAVRAALAAVAVRAALAVATHSTHSTHSTHAAAVSLAALSTVVAALAALAGGVVIVIHVDVTAQVALVDFLCYRFFGHDIDNFLLHDILSRNGGGEEGKDGESWELHGAGFFGCGVLGGICPASWICEPMKKRTYLPLRSLFVLGGIVSYEEMYRHSIYREPVACSGSTI
jgi:hypothetical protein